MADEKKVTAKDAAADTKDVQAQFDEAAERGYFGLEVDPTPRENYTLQTPPDAPVPENDEKAWQAAQERAAEVNAGVA